MKQTEKKVVIIGGGFSGIVTLINIVNLSINHPEELLKIVLYEKSSYLGGLAYSEKTTQHNYLMNVPIKIMDPFLESRKPFFVLSLLNWLNQYNGNLAPSSNSWHQSDFCPRFLFGKYLFYLLETTKHYCKDKNIVIEIQLNREVISYRMEKAKLMLQARSKQNNHAAHELACDAAILATGYAGLPTSDPLSQYQVENYISNILDQREKFDKYLCQIEHDDIKNIFILGMGTTALDILLNLDARIEHKDHVHIYLYSRNGLLHLPCPTASILIENFEIELNEIGIRLSASLKNLLFETMQKFYNEKQEGSPLQLAMQSIQFIIQKTVPHNEELAWLNIYNNYFKQLEKSVTCIPDTTFLLLAKLFHQGKLFFITQIKNISQPPSREKKSILEGEYALLRNNKLTNKIISTKIQLYWKNSKLDVIHDNKNTSIDIIMNAAGFNFDAFKHVLFGAWENVTFTAERRLVDKENINLLIYSLGPYCAEKYFLNQNIPYTEGISIVQLREESWFIANHLLNTLNGQLAPAQTREIDSNKENKLENTDNLINLTAQLYKLFGIKQKTKSYTNQLFSILILGFNSTTTRLMRLPTNNIQEIFDTLNNIVFIYDPNQAIADSHALKIQNIIYPIQGLISIALQTKTVPINIVMQILINGGYFLSFHARAAQLAIDWYRPFQENTTDLNLEDVDKKIILGSLYNYLAFSHHNVGLNDAFALTAKAREYLQLSDSTDSTDSMINAYIMGYIYYVQYERAEASSKSLDNQYLILMKAEKEFNDSYQILENRKSDIYINLNPMLANLLHALGTVKYFQAKVSKKLNQNTLFEENINDSISYFSNALLLRIKLYGKKNLHVARSFHKLGTAYEMKQKNNTAIYCYTCALITYHSSSLSPEHYIEELKTHMAHTLKEQASSLRKNGFFSSHSLNQYSQQLELDRFKVYPNFKKAKL